jgi:hypothetical protein
MYFVTTYERLHQYDRALAHRQKYWSLLGRSPEDVAELGEIFRTSGSKGALRRWAREAEARTNRTGYLTSTELTHVYAEIGDVEAGIRWLRRAIDDGARDVIYLAIEPGFDALRAHPQFGELARSAREPVSNATR